MIARLAILLLSLQPAAFACSCAGRAPVCQRIDRMDYAFLGRVLATNDTKDSEGGPYWYRFSVDEAFHGIGPEVREVIVDPDNSTTCRKSFEPGRLYLVVGHRSRMDGLAVNAAKANGALGGSYGVPLDGPIVSTSQCGGSLPAEYAAEDLTFLRAYKTGNVQPYVYGQVRIHAEEHMWDDRLPGLPGAFLHLSGTGVEQTVAAGADGRFLVAGLPPGSYQLTAAAPGYFSASPEYEVNVPPRGCGHANIAMLSHGSFTGTVTRSGGSPAPDLAVEYRAASPHSANLPLRVRSTRTNEKGEFFFPTVPPGDYHLGVHIDSAPKVQERIAPAYWPGAATAGEAGTLHLELNEQKTGLNIALGPVAKLRYATVKVLWPDGRPAARTTVSAYVGQDLAEKVQTDASGTASFSLLETVAYTVSVHETFNFRWKRTYGYEVDIAEAGPLPLPASAGQAETVLVLRKREPGR
ncbi:MAG: carboxypeptidase regulatory-like domain-containing protein [Paludibaculum sp.]